MLFQPFRRNCSKLCQQNFLFSDGPTDCTLYRLKDDTARAVFTAQLEPLWGSARAVFDLLNASSPGMRDDRQRNKAMTAKSNRAMTVKQKCAPFENRSYLFVKGHLAESARKYNSQLVLSGPPNPDRSPLRLWARDPTFYVWGL